MWIKCEDKLPAEGECLVFTDYLHPRIEMAYYTDCLEKVDKWDFAGVKRGGFYKSDSEGDYEIARVTHWMPLPDPPEEWGER